MKKMILAILCGVFGLHACYALTVCVRNNVYVGIFHKDRDGTVTRTNAPDKEFEIDFGYKTISGQAACNEINVPSNTSTTPVSVGDAVTNLVTTGREEGQYCWCQLWPVLNFGYESGQSTYWVYLHDYGTADACASGCMSNCANSIATNQTFRSHVFEAIW